MTDYFIGAETRQEIRKILQYKGDVRKHTLDFNVWADDNANVTGVTWTVESGQSSIGTETLVSNVAGMILTSSEPTSGVLKAVATDGTHSEAIYFQYLVRDPQNFAQIPDYGLVTIC